MRTLTNPVRDYAWGSHTAIARLQGRPAPSVGPEAELWMGAHPAAPSVLTDTGVALPDAIAADPSATLGPSVLGRYGQRLPFLLKVLAAAQPLSLQVHPDADQARAGFAADADRTGHGNPGSRNYVDPYHKPEVLVALEPFEALCGFRDPAVSAAELAALGLPRLAPLIEVLGDGTDAQRLRTATQRLLSWPAAERADLVRAAASAAREQGMDLVVTLAELHPADPGVLLAMLLNRVWLRPDEAVFMPAGNLHAYVRGTGVEVMAASDNVLRCGLTPKHVDVAETLRILRYEVLSVPVLRPVTAGPGLLAWPVPVPDFALVKAAPDGGTGPVVLPGGGPRIVACVRGTADLRAGDSRLTVPAGGAVFVDAREPAVVVHGDTSVFQASPGPLP